MKFRVKITALSSIALLVSLLSTGAHAVPIQWTSGSGGNDHWYEHISGAITWTSAKSAAESSVHLGESGYLATVTSAAENAFLLSLSADGWLGGSDAASEGTWKWIGGPEIGSTFWVGGSGGFSPSYANWGGGEPNNLGGEDYLHLSGGSWNDLPNNAYSIGYFVEYNNPVPAPPALLLLGLGLVGIGLGRRKA